jgi:hypothetical protein
MQHRAESASRTTPQNVTTSTATNEQFISDYYWILR